jgi:hypothetical protein
MSLGTATHWHRLTWSTAATEKHLGNVSTDRMNSYPERKKDALGLDFIDRLTSTEMRAVTISCPDGPETRLPRISGPS